MKKIRAKIILVMLIVFPMVINCSTYVLGAQLWADQQLEINADWFNAKPMEFNGHALDEGKYGRLNIDEGGHGMYEFINHGEIGYDPTTETHVYMAEAVFPFSVAIYTDAMIEDCYRYSYSIERERWLWLKTFDCWTSVCWGTETPDNHYYYAEWSALKPYMYDNQEYDGPIKIATDISPTLPFEVGDIITIGGIDFRVPDVQIYTNKITLTDRTYGVCDDPRNIYSFEVEEPIPIDSRDMYQLTGGDTDYLSSEGKGRCRGECGDGRYDWENVPAREAANDVIDRLGIHDARLIRGVTYTSTGIGQAFASSPTVGTTWDKLDDLNPDDDKFDFYCNIRLKPNIFYDMQVFTVTDAKLWVDTHDENNLWAQYGVCQIDGESTEQFTRIIGLGVQNIFIKMTFEARVYFLMTVEPVGDEGGDFLDDPEVYQGDIIWDATIRGDTDARVTVTKDRNPLGDWWSGVGDWWEDVWDEWTGFWDDIAEGWKDLSENLGAWWSEWWWLIILIGAGVLIAIAAIYLFPRITKGAATYQGERKRQKIKTEREKVYPSR